MRQAFSLLVLVFAVLGCLTVADGILEVGDNPSDFDGSADPNSGPVVSLPHLWLPSRRPLESDPPQLHRPLPSSFNQWLDLRVVLARGAMGDYSGRMPVRIPPPRRNTSLRQAAVSPYDDPARAI